MVSVFELNVVVMDAAAKGYPFNVWNAKQRLYTTLEEAEYAINVFVLEDECRVMFDEWKLYCFIVYEYPLDEDLHSVKDFAAISVRTYLANGKLWKQSIGDLLRDEHDNPFRGRPIEECSFDVGDVCEVFVPHCSTVEPSIVEARPLTPAELKELARVQEVEYTDSYTTINKSRGRDSYSRNHSIYLFPARFEIPQHDKEVLEANLERYEEVSEGVVDVMFGLPDGVVNPKVFGGSIESLQDYLYVPRRWSGCNYALLVDANTNYKKNLHPMWCYVVYPHDQETLIIPCTIGYDPAVLCVDDAYADVVEKLEFDFDITTFITLNMHYLMQLAEGCISEEAFMYSIGNVEQLKREIEANN